MRRSATLATVRAPPSSRAVRLCAVTLHTAETVGTLGAVDALEEAVRESIEGETKWLETQHALLRRALLQLHTLNAADGGPSPSLAQAERMLQLVSSAFHERLTSLDSAAAALRPE